MRQISVARPATKPEGGQSTIVAPSAVVLSEVFPPRVGGSGTVLWEIYSRLEPIPVVVLTDVVETMPSEQNHHSIRVCRMHMRSKHWGVLHPDGLRWHLSVSRQLRHVWGADLAVVHCCRLLPEGLSARIATLRPRVPYICWAHGEELGYIASSHELGWLAARVQSRAAAVIANSRNTARLLGQLGVPDEKIEVVYPGVDHSRFRPDVDARSIRSRYAPRGEYLLLSVGRLQARKGQDVAIQALARLGRRDVHYVIVGDGDELQHLRRLAEALGIAGLVTFEPRISPELLPEYFAASDIFLHPNRTEGADFEGFGLVFLEAAATGRPAIGGRSGGVPEAVVHSQTGLLVGGTDVDELVTALRCLLEAPDLRVRMGAAARQRVLKEFTWDRAAAAVRRIHLTVSGKR